MLCAVLWRPYVPGLTGLERSRESDLGPLTEWKDSVGWYRRLDAPRGGGKEVIYERLLASACMGSCLGSKSARIGEMKLRAPFASHHTPMSLVLSRAQCAKAAAAYRALLRAQRITFKGDDFALKAAHQQTRVLFNRFIPSASATRSPFSASDPPIPAPSLAPEGELTPEKVDQHIAGAFEIADFLKKNVVQGIRTEEGNYCELRRTGWCLADARVRLPPDFQYASLTILPPLPSPRQSCALHLRATTLFEHYRLFDEPPALRIHEETERGDNDSIKKANAEIPPEIKNVNLRRRRRRKGDAAEPTDAPAGCCGGTGASA
ncbi:hypothetical protein BMF94_6395 [Rhodotorula taiwanensis]|uniref:Mitochondrial zinc maintenance protein 1, mitochondrial n=1 Tax=Rhodotorula taiwanensis TaxID=741276 RepID=A0A2S5B1G0_9BASI|nr:hypothetical protein BMF94_6395 [Rhodotorula taiwanensis]